FAQHMPVVTVYAVDDQAARQRRARRTHPATIEHQPRALIDPGTETAQRMITDDPRYIRGKAACRRPDEIEQAALRLFHDVGGQVVKAQMMDKMDYVVNNHIFDPLLFSL